MPRGGRTARALAALFLGVLAASDARAQPTAAPTATRDEPRRSVDVALAGGSDDALMGSIRELFARLHVALGDAGPSALAHVRIDLTAPSEAVIVVVDGRTSAVRLRRTVARDATPSIVREEIAHAVQSAIEAELLAEQDRAQQRPPPPPTPVPTPPIASAPAEVKPVREAPTSTTASSPVALDVTTLAGAGPFANGSGAVVRIGGGLTLASRLGLRPSLTAMLHYAVPFETSSSVVVSHASLVSLRALPAIQIVHTSWLALDLGVGGGVDVLAVDPRSPVLPTSSLATSTTRVDPVLTAALAAQVAIASSVVFTLAAVTDVDLASRRYVVDEGGAQASVLAPWRVRPTLLAGFTFTALGDELFAEAPKGASR